MNRTAKTSLTVAIALPVLLSSVGCLRGASAVKELAEAAVAEALVTQSISSYNEVNVSVAVNDRSVALACNSGGTVDWSEVDTTEEICYSVDSRGCDFETASGRAFAIEGTSTMCGADDFVVTESALYAGQAYNLSGTATVSNDDGERTCSYDLDVSVDQVISDGVSYDVTVAGQLCNSQRYSASFSVDIEGNVSVDAE